MVKVAKMEVLGVKLVSFMMDSGIGARKKGTEFGRAIKETHTLASGTKTILMALGSTCGQMVILTKVSGICPSDTAKAVTTSEKVVTAILANMCLARPTATDSTGGVLMVASTPASFSTE